MRNDKNVKERRVKLKRLQTSDRAADELCFGALAATGVWQTWRNTLSAESRIKGSFSSLSLVCRFYLNGQLGHYPDLLLKYAGGQCYFFIFPQVCRSDVLITPAPQSSYQRCDQRLGGWYALAWILFYFQVTALLSRPWQARLLLILELRGSCNNTPPLFL